LSAAPSIGPLTTLPERPAAKTTNTDAPRSEIPVVHYRTTPMDGIDIFYRDADSKDAPVFLLLHGFPTSSRMIRNLMPLLADRYRIVAPNYPGFGQSAAPNHRQFEYSFAHYADLVDALLQKLDVRRYAST
jgi:pimeloyl-ACP methyl ester carboxylesterase